MINSSNTCVVTDNTVNWFVDMWEREVPHADYKFGFLSVPFDYCVSYRPGTRFGPKHILEQLNMCSTFCIDKRAELSTFDFKLFGDVDVSNNIYESHQNIESAVANMPSEFTPIILGGDHSISDPAFRAILEKHQGKVGLVVFDAHLDCREPVKGKEHSGHWMKTLEDVIDYNLVAQIGINANIYSKEYLETAEKAGVLIVTPYEIRKRGYQALVEQITNHFKGKVDKIYFSIDIDVFDQAIAPGTSVPNPSGLQLWEVNDTLFELMQNFEPAGLDITEVSPPLDNNNHTAKLASELILNYLSGVKTSKR